MIINKENYELYAIDYIDGNLSLEQQQLMEQFLHKNPSIKTELEELGMIVLTPDKKLVYEGKVDLMKPETRSVAWWKGALFLVFLLVLSSTILWHQVHQTNTKSQQTSAFEQQKSIPEKPITNTVIQKEVITTATKAQSHTNIQSKTIIIKETNAKEKVNAIRNIATENNKKTPVVELEEPAKKIDAQAIDSLKNDVKKPKIQPIPMASIEPNLLLLQSTDLMIEKMGEINSDAICNSIAFAETKAVNKSKSIKTPFGKIQFSDIAEAFLPESYIAGK